MPRECVSRKKNQIKVIVLCGGLGTRLAEETEVRPKPLIEIGGRPILWHILKHYTQYGFSEHELALGYKADSDQTVFPGYYHLSSSLTVCLGKGQTKAHDQKCEDWIVHLINTGVQTQTGGRIKHLASTIGKETFLGSVAGRCVSMAGRCGFLYVALFLAGISIYLRAPLRMSRVARSP